MAYRELENRQQFNADDGIELTVALSSTVWTKILDFTGSGSFGVARVFNKEGAGGETIKIAKDVVDPTNVTTTPYFDIIDPGDSRPYVVEEAIQSLWALPSGSGALYRAGTSG